VTCCGGRPEDAMCQSQLLAAAPETAVNNPPYARTSTSQRSTWCLRSRMFKTAVATKRRGHMAGGPVGDVAGDVLMERSALCQSRHIPEGTVGHGQPTPGQRHRKGTVSHGKPMLEWRKTSTYIPGVLHCSSPHQRD